VDKIIKLPITLGVLTYNAPETLKHTLNSYKEKGILDACADKIICIQDSPKKQEELDIVLSYSKDRVFPIVLKDNKWIGKGFREIVEHSDQDYILLLENDFACYDDDTWKYLHAAQCLLFYNRANVVRFRSQKNPGYPLYSDHLQGRELSCPTHLAECLHWNDNPAISFPEYCKKETLFGVDFFLFKAANANFTNNPCMFKKEFYKQYIYPFCIDDEDIETRITNEHYWANTKFQVANCKGLFTHDRKDGK